MAMRASKRLVEFLEDRAGEALRVVFHYDTRSEGFEILYMRPDIQDEYSEAELLDHFDTFRRDSHLAGVQQSRLRTGDHHCSIRVYDESLIFNFTLGDYANTIISLDPDVGRDLLGFVGKAMGELKKESGDMDWTPPRWV